MKIQKLFAIALAGSLAIAMSACGSTETAAEKGTDTAAAETTTDTADTSTDSNTDLGGTDNTDNTDNTASLKKTHLARRRTRALSFSSVSAPTSAKLTVRQSVLSKAHLSSLTLATHVSKLLQTTSRAAAFRASLASARLTRTASHSFRLSRLAHSNFGHA